MKETTIDATYLRPEGDRITDAPVVPVALAEAADQLRHETAWTTGDRNGITLFKTEALRIVLVALHAGAALTKDASEGVLCLQALEGDLQFRTHGELLDWIPGTMMVLHAGVPYEVRARTDALLLLTLAPE